MKKRRYAALTMVRDETFFLKLWHDYYSREFGAENLYVIDHNSQHHRPQDVCKDLVNVFRIPYDNPLSDPDAETRQFDKERFKFASDQISALLKYYDCVVFNDVDERFIIDSKQGIGLRGYLDSLPEIDIRCGVGIEIIHDIETEPPYQLEKPLFEQRGKFKYNLHFCKPWIIDKPVEITGHGAYAPFHIDPNILLVHLHWIDFDTAVVRQEIRQSDFKAGRGGQKSRWSDDPSDKEKKFETLLSRDTASTGLEHHEFLETLFPGYTRKPFSQDGYKRLSGRKPKLMEVTKFVEPQQKRLVESTLYQVPDYLKKS